MTRRGPHSSDSAPDSHDASMTATPYTVITYDALISVPAPLSAMYGAMKPDSTPSPIMNRSSPTYPRNRGAGSPHFVSKRPKPVLGNSAVADSFIHASMTSRSNVSWTV